MERARRLVPLYASTLFLTSALLFVLEPLVAKGLLPVLGGGAAVWTTAIAFFQLALLGGYLYAHLTPLWLGPRRQALAHVALLVIAAAALPLQPATDWVAPREGQAVWLFGRLAASVGPIFVLLSASAPLIQRWFAATEDRAARDPYFLYAASNAGSLIALLAYPVGLEPLLGLGAQRRWWTVALWAAIALVAACALRVRSAPAASPAASPSDSGSVPAPGERAGGVVSAGVLAGPVRWVILSAIPSSLLLSVTSYMTTDVVALPLLWVAPLALYLATFIIAFHQSGGAQSNGAGRRGAGRGRTLRLQAFLLLPIAAEMFLRTDAAAWVLVPLHALCFFVTAFVCHRVLADSRPGSARTTEFYLYVAAGGALGGMLNVFLAPVLFRTLLEYPLGLVAAALLRPSDPVAPGEGARATERRSRRLDLLVPALLGLLLALGTLGASAVGSAVGENAGLVVLVLLVSAAGAAGYACRGRSLRFGLVLAAIMAAGTVHGKGASRVLHTARSFYGNHKVTLEPPTLRVLAPTLRVLAHGNTTHGSQDLAPERRREPLTYYHRTGPIGEVMSTWRDRPQHRRVGVVGLGAGSLATYAAPGDRWTFFEIDPEVVDIARDPRLFTYLRDAEGAVDVATGDGRLMVAAEPDGSFGMLVLDAFSSDAVPAHLLSHEALALYRRKLVSGGLIAVHLSNRYLDLEPIVAGGAAAAGLEALVRFDSPTADEARGGKTASHWMVLAARRADLAPLSADPRWTIPTRVGAAWTDDASNLWSALRLAGR